MDGLEAGKIARMTGSESRRRRGQRIEGDVGYPAVGPLGTEKTQQLHRGALRAMCCWPSAMKAESQLH